MITDSNAVASLEDDFEMFGSARGEEVNLVVDDAGLNTLGQGPSMTQAAVTSDVNSACPGVAIKLIKNGAV